MKQWNQFKSEGIVSILFPVLSIVFGLLGAAVVIAMLGVDPLMAYQKIFLGSLGSKSGFTFALQYFMPLAFCGLAVTMAFRGGVFNVGAEGQLFMGAVFSTWAATGITGLSPAVHIPLAILIGAAAGGLWGLIPGYLKVKKGFNEVLVTIFMNYIAKSIVGASVSTFLKEPNQGVNWSSKIPEALQFKTFLGLDIHPGIIIAVLIAVAMSYMLKNTTFGYDIKSVGLNREAAEYAGIDAKKIMIVTMVLSGAIASLAGSVEILGMQYRLQENFLTNYGYYAIPVALMGGLNPYGTLITALFFAALLNGATAIKVSMGVPVSIANVIMALTIICSLAMNGLQRLLHSKIRK